ncbi:MAG TPA: rod shape-determining protein MreD [Actinomycetota bacterium]|nr:rod shape-determining protein MreD [Actinomycetota bacterium]
MVIAKEPRTNFLAEAGLARILAVGILVVLALALQSAVLARMTLLGVIPQLVLVVVVSLAYLQGERAGVVAGFAGGLLQDLLLPQSIVGLTALVYTLIAYGVGYLRQYTTAESVWTPVLAVAIASAIAEVSYSCMAVLLGQPWVSFGDTMKFTGLIVLYDTLLTPFVFPIVKRVSERVGSSRVYG